VLFGQNLFCRILFSQVALRAVPVVFHGPSPVMPQEHLALSTVAAQPAVDSDYDAICAAVMATARGRWFLDEFARRNRSADTATVLAAIQRIETAVRDTNEREAHQSIRVDLLEMARTIAATRAEVAEIKPEGGGRSAAPDAPETNSGVLAMAERIQDVAWTMRERGLDPTTCEQIEALATAILSASALRDPNDHRTRKLGEVLQYLEHRIARMLSAGNGEEAGEDRPRAAASHAPNELRPPGEAATAPEPPPSPASPAAELELEPLVVIPFPVREAVVDAAPIELELDPIVINLPPPADTAAATPAADDEVDAVAAIEEELFAPVAAETAADELATAAMSAPPLAMPQSAPNDPLAALKAMTYEERIALFS
jgi:hypothetical protein